MTESHRKPVKGNDLVTKKEVVIAVAKLVGPEIKALEHRVAELERTLAGLLLAGGALPWYKRLWSRIRG